MFRFSFCILFAFTGSLTGMPNKKNERTDDIFRRGFQGLFQGEEHRIAREPRQNTRGSEQSTVSEQDVFQAMGAYRDSKVKKKNTRIVQDLDNFMKDGTDSECWKQWQIISEYPDGLPRNFEEALQIAKFYRLQEKRDPQIPSRDEASSLTGLPQTSFPASFNDLITDILKGHEEKFDRMPPTLEKIESKLGHIRLYSPD